MLRKLLPLLFTMLALPTLFIPVRHRTDGLEITGMSYQPIAIVKAIQPLQAVPIVEAASYTPPTPEPAQTAPAAPTHALSHTELMAAAGISPSDYASTNYIITHESDWNPYSIGSPTSLGRACHIEQTLPCGKDGCRVDDVVCQLKWFKAYCVDRYGSIYGAYTYWLAHKNY